MRPRRPAIPPAPSRRTWSSDRSQTGCDDPSAKRRNPNDVAKITSGNPKNNCADLLKTETQISRNAGNKYTFAVHDHANKIQIKAAIEELYKKENVTVVSVNVLTTKAKEKRRGNRRGQTIGHTTPWRKAIVTLAPGQKIEFFEGV